MKHKNLLLNLFLALCIISNNNASAQCATTTTPYHYYYSWGVATVNAFSLASVASNNSGTTSNGYNSFSTPVRNLTIGSSYPWSASVGYQWYYTVFAIWIDLNGNGQYETNEMLASTSPNYNNAKSGNITIPASATPGSNRRMRIRSAWSYYASFTGTQACSSYPFYGYGETEDYYVNLISPCAGPTITTQPSNQLACPDGSATFTLAATSAATYKWQVSTNSGATFADISDNTIYAGTSTNTLLINHLPASYNNYQYRCVATSGCGTPTNSSAAMLYLHTPVSFASQTMSVSTCEGSAKSISITPGAGVVSNYRWQIGTLTNGFTDITATYPYANVNTANLDIQNVPSSIDGQLFRCIIEGPCSADTSAAIPMTVLIGPYISDNPVDDTIPPYTNAKFEVKTLGTPYYELFWQASTDGGATYSNINDNSLYSGTHGIGLAVKSATPALTGMKFRCILKSINPDCGFYYDTSEAATLYVGNYGGLTVKSSTDIPENAMSLFPNPATGNEIYLTMKNPINAELSISVIDKLGKTVYTTNGNLSKKNSKLAINTLVPGVYSVQVTDFDGNRISSLQFTKQ